MYCYFLFTGMTYAVTEQLDNICSSEKLLLLSKYKNTAVTVQQIIEIHKKHLNVLLERYQAQPADYDEWIRSQFIIDMISSYTQYVDGVMLWIAIPTIPHDKKMFRWFELNVLDVIKNTYDHLYKNKIALDTVSVIHILYRFMKRWLFHDAYAWVIRNTNVDIEQIQFPSFIDW